MQMSYRPKLHYYQRVLSAYLGSSTSQLTFWHDTPTVNENFSREEVAEYYMPFFSKANYQGPFDGDGIPQLDYRGQIGRQYNPIAIAQYGLGNFNLWRRTGESKRREKYLHVADWLRDSLEPNSHGYRVWMHKFDWEYRDTLKAPWYSGLAQGQGISLLIRAFIDTGESTYLKAADAALASFWADVTAGGVAYKDPVTKDLWFEEYIVSPPTHILNGFIWASWGIYDFYLATKQERVRTLFDSAMQTLQNNLQHFDTGYWSLYELSNNRLKMLASPFYHQLHIVQLAVLHRLTGITLFRDMSLRWEEYGCRAWNRNRSYIEKALFKLCYY